MRWMCHKQRKSKQNAVPMCNVPCTMYTPCSCSCSCFLRYLGVYNFFVPLRRRHDFSCLPGVTVGDIGGMRCTYIPKPHVLAIRVDAVVLQSSHLICPCAATCVRLAWSIVSMYGDTCAACAHPVFCTVMYFVAKMGRHGIDNGEL